MLAAGAPSVAATPRAARLDLGVVQGAHHGGALEELPQDVRIAIVAATARFPRCRLLAVWRVCPQAAAAPAPGAAARCRAACVDGS